jgi:hypothetical protein
MGDLARRYSWVWQLAMTAFLVGGAWMQVQSTQNTMAAMLQRDECRLTDLEKSRRERDVEILTAIARMEERIAGLQKQLEKR